MAQPARHSRLVVVSNRLPLTLVRDGVGLRVEPGTGGLVTALAPVLRNRGGLWIGWPGVAGDFRGILAKHSRDTGYELEPVALSEDDIAKYYFGFANEVLWPLFHDLQSRCNFDPTYWEAYERVNEKFARAIMDRTSLIDFVWVHDYHLALTAQKLRGLGSKARLGFFLHVPFPPLDIFLKLPWRRQLLRALTEFDLVGFQTMRDRRNFTQCVRALLGEPEICGRGHVCEFEVESRRVRVGAFPISIDFRGFESASRSKEVAKSARQIHENLPNRQIVLGIDRLDYTKGIPDRLRAFRALLERYPEHRGEVTLVQVVIPSRLGIPEYEGLKTEIERLTGEINGQFSGPSGWVPIYYVYRLLERRELLGYYRAAEVGLVTPLKDGMNLVAKEYCACSLEESSVLILSEFAGAAAEFQDAALLVNPYDVTGVADALHAAIIMEPAERAERMRRLRQIVRRRDIFWWVDSYLRASIEKDLDSFPVMEDYVPDGA